MNPTNMNSILDIQASGSIDIHTDLLLDDGKSIAQLLYDQKKDQEKK